MKNFINPLNPDLYGENIRRVMKLSECGFPKGRIPIINIGVPAGKPQEKAGQDYTNVYFPFNFFPRVADGYVIQVNGHSMVGAGIDDGDLLLVNRSASHKHRDIVVACINGEMTVKRYLNYGSHVIFAAENDGYLPIKTTAKDDVDIFGVVIRVIKEPK